MKIRDKLFVLLITLTIVPLVLLGSVSYYVARSAVEEKVQEQLLKVRDELTSSTSAELARLNGTLDQLEHDQNFELYLRYTGKKDVSFLTEIIQKSFEYHLGKDPRLTGVSAVFPSGDSLAVVKVGQTIQGGADQGLSVTASGFCLGREVKRGDATGILKLHFTEDVFMRAINAAAIGGGKPVAGFLVAGRKMLTADHEANDALLSSSDLGAEWISYSGRVAASGQLSRTSTLIVGASMSEDEFLAPVRRVRNISAVIVLVMMVLAGVVSWRFAGTITRPVADMVGLTHRVAAGDLDARLESARKDELGDLARDFNAMAAKLKTTIGDLDKRVRELSALYDASSIIHMCQSLSEVLELSAELLESGLGVTKAVFFRATDDQKSFVPVFFHGMKERDLRLPADLTFLKKAFATKRVTVIEKFAEDAELAAALPKELAAEMSLCMIVPITAAGASRGLILVTAAHDAALQETRQLLDVLASLISPLFITSERVQGAILFEKALTELQAVVARVEKLDSRCAVVSVRNAAGRTCLQAMTRETKQAYLLTPHLAVGVFAGLTADEARATVEKLLASCALPGKAEVRAAGYPDDAEEAVALLAGVTG